VFYELALVIYIVRFPIVCMFSYCECFASGRFCDHCNCSKCFNNEAHSVERTAAVQQILERNPHAFRPKVPVSKESESFARHFSSTPFSFMLSLTNAGQSLNGALMASGWRSVFKTLKRVQLQKERLP
jgi:hypothetical protein